MTVSAGTILRKGSHGKFLQRTCSGEANHLKSRGRTLQGEDKAKALMGRTSLEYPKRRKNSSAEA